MRDERGLFDLLAPRGGLMIFGPRAPATWPRKVFLGFEVYRGQSEIL